ncbi:hypothetical protein BDA96_05G113600 [Sorghum bicolor]|uniref:Uncharacterized protein n=2 Tax=Sorghum bicolor TaxID=4558 RepID=A0A921QXC4_SORBI|nr:hypothetical protein BDA96_05G113600 [Sorghum bicolor]KXG28314.1 hypothetical protein SORBI_3005G108700 [Sorghum bicolor]
MAARPGQAIGPWQRRASTTRSLGPLVAVAIPAALAPHGGEPSSPEVATPPRFARAATAVEPLAMARQGQAPRVEPLSAASPSGGTTGAKAPSRSPLARRI